MSAIRITYDEEADVLAIYLAEDYWDSIEELEPDVVIAHFNADARLVALEIMNASERLGGDPLALVNIERYPGQTRKPAGTGRR